jgi:hypothetical protein
MRAFSDQFDRRFHHLLISLSHSAKNLFLFDALSRQVRAGGGGGGAALNSET